MNLQGRLAIYSEINSDFAFLFQLNKNLRVAKAELLQQLCNSEFDETFPNKSFHSTQLFRSRNNDAKINRLVGKERKCWSFLD